MKNIDIPTWEEVNERLENFDRSDRTVAAAAMHGSELTPLEAVIHAYDDSDKERSQQFIGDIKKLVEWCINDVDSVLRSHE